MARRVTWAVVVLALLFLVAPVLIVIPMSLSSSGFLEFPPPGFTTRWFSEFFQDQSWIDAMLLSARVALGATVLAVVGGTMAAYGLVRGRVRFRSASQGVLMLPMVIPTIVYGAGAYLISLRLGLVGSELLLMAAHAVLALPYVVLNLIASIGSTDRRLELVAQSLGASPWTTFRTVTLPLIAPAIVASALVVLVISLDETVVALFLTSDTAPTLPVKVYNSIRYELSPLVPVAAAVVMGATIALAAVLLGLRWVLARAVHATGARTGSAELQPEGAA
jgi:putative spermidine/putrescine transport system permease protein